MIFDGVKKIKRSHLRTAGSFIDPQETNQLLKKEGFSSRESGKIYTGKRINSMIIIFLLLNIKHSTIVKERGVAFNMFSDRLIGELSPSNTRLT